MMPQMPQMPGLPKQENSSSAETPVSDAPFTDESVGNAADSDVGLDTPSHNEEDPVSAATPSIHVHAAAPATEVKVSLPPTKGIRVVATRKGFYNQMRYKDGDQFLIRSEADFGEWMKCLDPGMEAKRLKFYEQKRLNQRKA